MERRLRNLLAIYGILELKTLSHAHTIIMLMGHALQGEVGLCIVSSSVMHMCNAGLHCVGDSSI